VFLSEAQEEYEEALFWYLEKNIEVAESFVSAVDKALSMICNYPFRWRNELGEYREINLKRFPFSIVYLIDSNRALILITSVYHHKRNPESKYKK
jgi:plasmid stabilization system protein ParE